LGRVTKTMTLATVGLAVTAGTAQAATVAIDPVKACYLTGEESGLNGTGFSPGGTVNIAVDGEGIPALTQVADAAGNFASGLRFGGMDAVKTHTLTATDATNPALTAAVNFVGTRQQVASKSSRGKPGKKTKLRGYGFIFGRKAYMHVRGHGVKTNKFLARPKAPCGTFTVRRAFVTANAPVGKYRVQFDHTKGYKKNRAGSVAYELTVYRTFNSSAFAAPDWALDPIG
jgi:hypothetical protein